MRRTVVILLVLSAILPTQASEKLTGKVIGTEQSVDYNNTSSPSTTVNTREMAFDGDMNTCFASWERSYTWTGLDLGERHVITRVGWSPRNDGQGPRRVVLGMFEGANREDFTDALPLYIITEEGTIGKMSYADTYCTRGFRYVRYVGPSDARCNIAEVEFYGDKGAGDDSHLAQLTNLPTVVIRTKDNEEPYDKEHEIEAFVSIVWNGGRQLLADTADVRLRGNASKDFPKKPYRLRFRHKHRVLNSPAMAKKWTLINNYGDKTLMRNQLAFELSRRLGMPYTPFCAYVDVVLNGEYKGSYQLCDQVQVHPDRINVKEMTPRDNSGEALTGGYLIEADAYASSEPVIFWSDKGTGVTIKSPSADSITSQQWAYIKDCYNKMESNWKQRLDINTFLRHFLVGEASGNTDTYWSVYFYKRRGNDTLYTGPVWDFDLAFDNDNRTYPVNNKTDFIYRSGGSYTGYMRSLADQVAINYAPGKQMLTEIWGKAREEGLTEENFIAYIDEQAEMLAESQELNFKRWKIMNTTVHQNPRIWGSYEAEVENVKNFVRKRIAWMDKKVGYTYVPPSPPESALQDMPANTIDYSKPYCVFTVTGQQAGTDIKRLPQGVYIIRQGEKSRVQIVE